MKRILLLLALAFTFLLPANAQTGSQDNDKYMGGQALQEMAGPSDTLTADVPLWDTEIEFVQRDTCALKMLMFMPETDTLNRPCVVFIYGGGFMISSQREKSTTRYCRQLADAGFVVADIDYRLGLKGFKTKGGPLSMASAVEQSVYMATEDAFSAVSYIIDHAEQLGVDPARIILIGSSAGAITSLQCDYELCNRTSLAAAMPEDFRFAGIISFSGAIFTRNSPLRWTVHDPAPTALFHGTEDTLVTYGKIQFFKLGFFGSKFIDQRMDKFDYPHVFFRYEGHYHDVASRMSVDLDKTLWFIRHCVFNGENLNVDTVVDDHYQASDAIRNLDMGALYKAGK